MADLEPWVAPVHWSRERCEAFNLYRDFGPARSQQAVADKLSKSRQLMARWAAEDGWMQRCAQYDAYQDSLRREEADEAVRAMSRRHAESLATTWQALSAPAVELAKRLQTGDKTLEAVSTADLISAVNAIGRVLPRLVQAERLVHGISTENVETTDAAASKSLDDAESYLLGMEDGTQALDGDTPDDPKELPAGS